MQLEACEYTGVYQRLNHLPQGIHQAYFSFVGGPFWNQDQDRPSQLLGDTPHAPHVMYEVYQSHPPLPLWRGLQLLPRVCLQLPLLEVLRSEVGITARPAGE